MNASHASPAHKLEDLMARAPKTEVAVAAAPVERADNERSRLLGARLQELRRMRGLSLKNVAEETGLSPSFLSMVERGQTDLSVTRFSRLTEFYKVAPSELLMEMGDEIEDPEISSLKKFRSLKRGPGIAYRVLQDENPEMIYCELEPHARFSEPWAHRGEDFWLVLDGNPCLDFGGKSFDLSPGQTVRFSSTVPHGLSNPGDTPARLVAICSVPYW